MEYYFKVFVSNATKNKFFFCDCFLFFLLTGGDDVDVAGHALAAHVVGGPAAQGAELAVAVGGVGEVGDGAVGLDLVRGHGHHVLAAVERPREADVGGLGQHLAPHLHGLALDGAHAAVSEALPAARRVWDKAKKKCEKLEEDILIRNGLHIKEVPIFWRKILATCP